MKDMTVLGLLITLKSHLVNTVIMHDVSEMEKCKSYEAELLRRFEAMKCCGNCQWSISRNCKDWQRYRDCGSYPALDSYCDKWQYDGLTRAERERDRAFK